MRRTRRGVLGALAGAGLATPAAAGGASRDGSGGRDPSGGEVSRSETSVATASAAAGGFEADRVTVYDRNGVDQVVGVVPLAVGGAVLAGSTVAPSSRNPWFVRVDPDGARRWSVTSSGGSSEQVSDVTRDVSGDVIAAGVAVTGRDAVRSTFLRVRPDGSIAVRRAYGAGDEVAQAVAPLGTGNYALAGRIRDGEGGSTGVVRTVRPDGEPVDRWRVAAGDGTALTAAAGADEGDLLVAGWRRASAEAPRTPLVARYDADGRERWRATADVDVAAVGDVVEAPDGDVVAGGASDGLVPKAVFARFAPGGERLGVHRDDREPDSQVNALLRHENRVVFGGLLDGEGSSAWVGVLDDVAPASERRVGPSLLTAVQGLGSAGGDPVAVGTTRFGSDGQDGYLCTLRTANASPKPVVTYQPESPAVAEAVRFDAGESTDPDGVILGYQWDFDGDGTIDAEGRSASHRFRTPGRHRVRLRVVDDRGATATRTVPVDVVDPRSSTDATDGGTDDAETESSAPGLGVPAALAGVGGAALAAWRRR